MRPAAAADAFRTMESDPRFTEWTALIEAGNLEGYARRSGEPFTVFAAQNESFANIPIAVMQKVMPHVSLGGIDTTETVATVRSHVLPGLHESSEFTGRKITLKTVNNLPLTIDATNASHILVTFARSTGYISGAPIVTDNAIIYPVTLTKTDLD